MMLPGRFVGGVVAFLFSFVAAGEAPAAVNASLEDETRALCSGQVTPFTRSEPSSAPSAHFKLTRKGEVVAAKDSNENSFQLEDASDDAVLRIDLIDGTTAMLVGCAKVSRAIVTLDPARLSPSGQILLVSYFDKRADTFEEARQTATTNLRLDALLTPEVARREVEKQALLTEVGALHKQYLAADTDVPNKVTITLTALLAMAQTARDALVATAKSTKDPFELRLAVEANRLEPSWTMYVSSLEEANTKYTSLVEARASVAKAEAALKGAKTPTDDAKQKLEAATKAADKAKADYLGARLAVETTALTFPSDVQGPALLEHCRAIERLKWLGNSQLRLIARAQLPAVPSAGITTVSFGTGSARTKGLDTGRPVGLLVKAVPTGVPVSFSVARTEHPPPDLAKLLANALSIVLPEMPEKRAYETKSALCPQPVARPDLETDSLALQGTRAFVVPHFPKSQTTQVDVCSGTNCAENQSNLRNRIRLEPKGDLTASLLIDLGANMEVTGPLGVRPIRSKPRFEALPRSAPDQLYVLRYPVQLSEAFAASLLITARYKRFAVGAGPSLWAGGGPALSQWNVKLGYALTPGVYVTAGGGVRVVQKELFHTENQIVVGVGEERAAPEIRTYDAAIGVVNVGLAIDVDAIGSAGESLLKAIGVKK